MKERPIPFSAPMVRALLSGAKTQTRRIVKPQPAPHESWDWSWPILRPGVTPGTRICWRDDSTPNLYPYCPYGVPGDRLWVREVCRAEELSRPQQTRPATPKEQQQLGRTTVIELDEMDGVDGVRYLADDAWVKIANTPEAGEHWSALYHYRGRGKAGIGNQVPSIHMPRWVSRLTLEITDVRVERLHDIGAEDAVAEGLKWIVPGKWSVDSVSVAVISSDPREAYFQLWDHINGEGASAANPWVWAVSFQRQP